MCAWEAMALIDDMEYPEGTFESLRCVCLCVCHWRIILWSSRDADTVLKNRLVPVPENSAQGCGLLMERIILTTYMSLNIGTQGCLFLLSVNSEWIKPIKLSLREKGLINKDQFCNSPTWVFSWVFIKIKPTGQSSHFSMNSIYLFLPWVSID